MTAANRPGAPGRANLTPEQQNALLGSLVDRVVAQATGTSYPVGTRLTAEHDRGRLWLGMLASEPTLQREADKRVDTTNRILPPAQGFSFRTQSEPLRLDLTVSCAFYLALHPTYEEQIAPLRDTDGAAPVLDTRSRDARPIVSRWTKVSVDEIALPIEIDTTAAGTYRFHEDEISDRLLAARRTPPGAEFYRPLLRGNPAGELPRDADLLDERAWSRYCAANLLPAVEVIAPEHRAAIQVDVSPQGNGLVEVLISVVNRTPTAEQQLVDGRRGYEDRRLDTRFYEVVMTADIAAKIEPYDLEQVARSHRYDRSVEAFGHAGPVTVRRERGITRLRTEFAASEQTYRVYPRETVNTGFDRFVADPVGTADELLVAFAAWVDREWGTANLARLADERGWNPEAQKEARKDAEKARNEVEWIRAGVDLLRTDPAVRDAFLAANRAMKNAGKRKGIREWYPFQVAWILGCLPGMADPAANPEVSIVWFATGGGKSEAYLGLMLVTLFYGRYTGTTAGAQVWARFPLRLLALQQTERFASMVLHAELIRREDGRISDGDPFGVGFFAGGGNTPNKLYAPGSRFYRGLDPRSSSVAEMCRILQDCPVCGDPLSVYFDERAWTMRHACRNAGCALQGDLPVWSVDDDIYRNAPSVLVGTVDKLAALGFSKEFQILIGRAHSRCPRHGYRADPNWCAVFGCDEKEQPVAKGFGHVRLEIADELHLLEESLGALDGMYETLLQAISERLGNPPMHIVGATATIEGYETQVDHLYQRDARRFPENGPNAGETFWSVTNSGEPMRRYVGVRPRVGTMVTATGEVAGQHRQWAKDLATRPEDVLREAGLDANDPSLVAAARQAGIDDYEVMVAYCLRTEDLNTVTRDDKVTEGLDRQGNLAVINGDTDPSVIRNTVTRLVTPPSNDAERVKFIAATKAIGHGFDVARLGVMAVMGTPTQAAEIIQASARVGRKHPGLVINIANPQRDRDSSVYRYYAEWIRYLDRMVHKVPVNRNSLQVLQRLLSGGLMAWLLQVHDRQWITGARRRKSLADSTAFAEAVKSKAIDRDMLIADLSRGFGINDKSVYFDMHRDAIATWVDEQLTSLPVRAHANTRLANLLDPPVPRSLRDVQKPLTIHGDI